MKLCPKCNINMIIIQDDTPHPYSWGGFRLYGCQNCHMIYYQHLDDVSVESKPLTEEELKRMQPHVEPKKQEEKETDKLSDEELKRMKKLDKDIKKGIKRKKETMKILDDVRKKRKWIKKPYYDPYHHHDSHLIN